MVSAALASLIMSDMQAKKFIEIESEGYIYPTLIIMHQDTVIKVEDLTVRYNNILSTEYFSGGTLLNANITVVTLRNNDTADDEAIFSFIKEVSFRHKPDAIGFIAQSLYKSVNILEQKIPEDLNKDPESIRVLHNCFYLRNGIRNGYVMSTPYIRKDAEEKKSEFEFDDCDDEGFVAQLDKFWEVSSSRLLPLIGNPYIQ